MSEATIYIHIGFEKTGTTAIQSFLDSNNEILRTKFDCVHPDCISFRKHPKLVALTIPDKSKRLFERLHLNSKDKIDKFLTSFKKELHKEIHSALSQNKDVILSSEHLSSLLKTEADIMKFKRQLEPYNVPKKIICYIRRQDDFLLSRYSTWIKSGGTNKLNLQRHNPLLLYHNILQSWLKEFGKDNMIIKEYNVSKFPCRNVIIDFLETIKIKKSEDFIFPKKAMNISLDNKTLLILRALNEYVPHFKGEKLNIHRGNLASDIAKLSLGEKLKFSTADQAYILSQFKKQNEKLLRDFGIDFVNHGLPHVKGIKGLEFNYSSKLELHNVYEAFGYLWEKQQKKILWLINRVKELENSTSEEQ